MPVGGIQAPDAVLLRIAGVDAARGVGCEAQRPAAGGGHLGRRAVIGHPVDLAGLAADIQDPIGRQTDALGVIDAVRDELELVEPKQGRRGEVEPAGRRGWCCHATLGPRPYSP